MIAGLNPESYEYVRSQAEENELQCELRELQADRERLELLFDGVLLENQGVVIIDRRSPDDNEWIIIHDRKQLDAAMKEAENDSTK